MSSYSKERGTRRLTRIPFHLGISKRGGAHGKPEPIREKNFERKKETRSNVQI